MKTYSLAVTTIAFAALVGCSSAVGDAQKETSGDTSGSSASESLTTQVVGTWNDTSYPADGGPFMQITLTAAGTYDSVTGDSSSITTTNGTWAIQTSGPQLGDPGGASQLALTDQSGQQTFYFVSVTSGDLVLSEVFNGTAFTFTPPTVGSSGSQALTTQVVGTWNDTSYPADGGPFMQITLNAAGTYDSVTGDSNSITTTNGTWAIQTSGPQLGDPGGASELALTDQSGQQTFYFVSVTSGDLVLSEAFNGTTFTFTPPSAVGSPGSQALTTQVVGTWNDTSYPDDGGPFMQITLNAAGTYDSVTGDSNSITTTNGTWAIQTSGPQLGAPGGASELALTDPSSQQTFYFVSVTSGNLVLSEVFNGTLFTFTP